MRMRYTRLWYEACVEALQAEEVDFLHPTMLALGLESYGEERAFTGPEGCSCRSTTSTAATRRYRFRTILSQLKINAAGELYREVSSHKPTVKVVVEDEMEAVVKQVHEDLGHGSYRTTHQKICELYDGITREVVTDYISRCECKKKQESKANNGEVSPRHEQDGEIGPDTRCLREPKIELPDAEEPRQVSALCSNAVSLHHTLSNSPSSPQVTFIAPLDNASLSPPPHSTRDSSQAKRVSSSSNQAVNACTHCTVTKTGQNLLQSPGELHTCSPTSDSHMHSKAECDTTSHQPPCLLVSISKPMPYTFTIDNAQGEPAKHADLKTVDYHPPRTENSLPQDTSCSSPNVSVKRTPNKAQTLATEPTIDVGSSSTRSDSHPESKAYGMDLTTVDSSVSVCRLDQATLDPSDPPPQSESTSTDQLLPTQTTPNTNSYSMEDQPVSLFPHSLLDSVKTSLTTSTKPTLNTSDTTSDSVGTFSFGRPSQTNLRPLFGKPAAALSFSPQQNDFSSSGQYLFGNKLRPSTFSFGKGPITRSNSSGHESNVMLSFGKSPSTLQPGPSQTAARGSITGSNASGFQPYTLFSFGKSLSALQPGPSQTASPSPITGSNSLGHQPNSMFSFGNSLSTMQPGPSPTAAPGCGHTVNNHNLFKLGSSQNLRKTNFNNSSPSALQNPGISTPQNSAPVLQNSHSIFRTSTSPINQSNVHNVIVPNPTSPQNHTYSSPPPTSSTPRNAGLSLQPGPPSSKRRKRRHVSVWKRGTKHEASTNVGVSSWTKQSEHVLSVVDRPWQRFCVDYTVFYDTRYPVGHLGRKVYLLLAMDHFSRMAWAWASREAPVFRPLAKHLMSLSRWPQEISCSRGKTWLQPLIDHVRLTVGVVMSYAGGDNSRVFNPLRDDIKQRLHQKIPSGPPCDIAEALDDVIYQYNTTPHPAHDNKPVDVLMPAWSVPVVQDDEYDDNEGSVFNEHVYAEILKQTSQKLMAAQHNILLNDAEKQNAKHTSQTGAPLALGTISIFKPNWEEDQTPDDDGQGDEGEGRMEVSRSWYSVEVMYQQFDPRATNNYQFRVNTRPRTASYPQGSDSPTGPSPEQSDQECVNDLQPQPGNVPQPPAFAARANATIDQTCPTISHVDQPSSSTPSKQMKSIQKTRSIKPTKLKTTAFIFCKCVGVQSCGYGKCRCLKMGRVCHTKCRCYRLGKKCKNSFKQAKVETPDDIEGMEGVQEITLNANQVGTPASYPPGSDSPTGPSPEQPDQECVNDLQPRPFTEPQPSAFAARANATIDQTCPTISHVKQPSSSTPSKQMKSIQKTHSLRPTKLKTTAFIFCKCVGVQRCGYGKCRCLKMGRVCHTKCRCYRLGKKCKNSFKQAKVETPDDIEGMEGVQEITLNANHVEPHQCDKEGGKGGEEVLVSPALAAVDQHCFVTG